MLWVLIRIASMRQFLMSTYNRSFHGAVGKSGYPGSGLIWNTLLGLSSTIR